MPESYDLIVVGGGPGGYVAAIRAAQLRLKTALIEREHLGGICLNWGCIPTKALLRASELWSLFGRAEEFGFHFDGARFDLAKIVDRSAKVAATLNRGVAHLLRKNQVRVLDGHGQLTGPGRVRVTKEGKSVGELTAPHIVLATGARPRMLPGVATNDRIWTYKEAMRPPAMPKSLLIVGSGAIGIEFASFYRALGAEVTVVEIVDRVLPSEDEEISALARKAFAKHGVKFETGATVTALKADTSGVTARLQKKSGGSETLSAERAILAIGIVGNTENIGLENTGAKVEKGQIRVDPYCRTAEPGLYAIGDVVGPPWLAHKASHEGVLCVEMIAGLESAHPLNAEAIPACTYSAPQIASVGLTEAQAKAAGRTVKVGRFPFIGNGKAIALGESEGLVKTLFDAETGELLGAHMIGPEVTELIQGFCIAKTLETSEAELIAAVFAHPTLSEAMHEAALDAWGRVIHF